MTPQPRFDDRSVPIVAIRLVVLLAGLFAEIWNLVELVGERGRLSEHLGYFTVQSNLLVLALVAWMLLRPDDRPRWFDAVRGAVTAYIVLTGLVWAVLLASPAEALGFDVAYPSFAQHRLIPVLMAADWLLVPTRRPLRVGRCIAAWMLYPLVYLAGTWLRGGLGDGWIPYPFLDPAQHGGPAGLVIPAGQVLVAFVVGIALVAAVGRLRHGRARSEPSRPIPPVPGGAGRAGAVDAASGVDARADASTDEEPLGRGTQERADTER